MSKPDYSEADSFRKGFATVVDQEGASSGDVLAVGEDGELALAAPSEGGGSGQSFIQIQSNVVVHPTAPGLAMLSLNLPMPVDPVGFKNHFFRLTTQQPMTTYGADWVAQMQQMVVSFVDTRHDAYFINVWLVVMNADASEYIELRSGVLANNGIEEDQVAILPADMTVATSEGADLYYDPDTGFVYSTGGGDYLVQALYSGGYD